MKLSTQDTARRYLKSSIELIQRSGFKMSLIFEMESWASLMRSVPRATIVNPTFDPSFSDLSPGDAFWISISDTSGSVVACIADRLIQTENFMAEIESGRLWYNSPSPEQRVELTTEASDLLYPGMVGHAGGLWVHPKARGIGLSWLLPRLCRALSIMNWNVDRHCGMVFGDLYASGMTAQSYGFPESARCINGWFPPTHSEQLVYVVHISREQLLSQLQEDIDIIDGAGDKGMRDIATVVGKGQQQAPIRAAVV